MSGAMEASVLLQLRDDLTRPARQAAASVKSLVKDLEKLKSLTSKSNGAAKHMQGMVRELKKAQTAAKELRREMARPAANGFSRAISGIERVRNEARQATRAVAELEGRLRRGGNFNGRVSGGGGSHGGGGGSRGHGGRHGGHGILGHSGRHFARHALGTAGGMAFAALGGEIVEGIGGAIRAGIEQSFEKNHTMAMLQMQGESVGDINKAVAVANKMARDLPQFTSAQYLEAIAELRPALTGGFKEAMALAPMFQQAVGVLESVKTGSGGKALTGVDTHGEALDLVRALEIKGETSRFGNDEEKNNLNMKSYVNGMTKAIVAFNGQIGAGDFHSAFKFSKFASQAWSQDFTTEILPTLMNEMKNSPHAKASSTGVALKSMYQTIVGNVMTGPAMDAWYKMGMYDKSQLDFKKDGHVKGVKTGEHMKGWTLFQEDPYKFVQDIALPAMKDHGIDIANSKAVQAEMKAFFGNRNAEFIADVLALQKAMIEKDRENVKKAMGADGLKFLQNSDATTRMQVFAAAFKELGGAIGDLTLSGNMSGLKGLIDWAHSASDAVKGSSYGKKLGGYYNSLIAGMFGQSLGRKGMAGRNGEYYGAGKSLGGGWNHFMGAEGKMLKFWEEIGVFSGALKVAGFGLNMLGYASDWLLLGFNKVKNVLGSSQFVADIKAHFKQTIDDLPNQFTQAGKTITDALDSVGSMISAVGKWFTDHIPDWMLPKANAAGATPQMLSKGQTAALAPVKVGDGGAAAAVKSMFVDMATAAATGAPGFQQAGLNSTAALAAGIQSGDGQATAAMSGLMGSLAAIASKGVEVDVRLLTAGAEAQLSALMNKSLTPALKGSGSGGKFSKSLSDIGQ